MRIRAFVLCIIAVVNSQEQKGCTYPPDKSQSQSQKKGEAQISPLTGRRLHFEDDKYKYDIGICVTATYPIPDDQTGKQADLWKVAGVTQFEKKNDSNAFVLGRIDQADILAGPEWVMLEYNGGTNYSSHCGSEPRTAKIMFICDTTVTEDVAILLEEQNSKYSDCYYMFEISTPVVCPSPPSVKTGLSVGSILLIVFFSVAVFYLLAGCLYNRFVLHAKGLDQIPNLSFWEDFGNLQADGCDLVCRSRKSRQPRTYKGLGDDQLGGESEQTNTDEHLLPM